MHVRTFINMTLKQAVKHDLIISHPGVAADLPRMEKPKVAQVITADEVATLLEEAQKGTGRWYPLIFFAVTRRKCSTLPGVVTTVAPASMYARMPPVWSS